MTRDHFCGVDAGPRTVFIVDVICGYDISRFSFFQGLDSEYEVLLLPMSQFEVVHAAKNIIDPKESEQAGVRVVRYAAAVQVSGATGPFAPCPSIGKQIPNTWLRHKFSNVHVMVLLLVRMYQGTDFSEFVAAVCTSTKMT